MITCQVDKWTCGPVIANIDCQHDYICKQPKLMQLSIPTRDFPDCIMRDVKTHPKPRSHLLVKDHTKRAQGKKAFAFYMFAHTFTGKFIYPIVEAFP